MSASVTSITRAPPKNLAGGIEQLIAEVKRLKAESAQYKEANATAQDTIGRIQKIRQTQEADIIALNAKIADLQFAAAGHTDVIQRLNSTIADIVKQRTDQDGKNMELLDRIGALTVDIGRITDENATLSLTKQEIGEAWELLAAADIEVPGAAAPATNVSASIVDIMSASVPAAKS